MNIGVIGKGKMGTDIFYYLNEFDFNLRWVCRSKDDAVDLNKTFQKRLERLRKNELISEEQYKSKIKNTIINNDLVIFKDCEIVIESIIEDENIKKYVISQIEKTVKDDCIIITNTSSINPSRLFISDKIGTRLIALHFFYPVKIKNISELVYTKQTDKSVLDRVILFLSKIKKDYLLLDEENSFVLNKLFLPMQSEAVNISFELKLEPKIIDGIIKKKYFPIGIFELFDSVGIDTMKSSISNYLSEINDDITLNHYKNLIEILRTLVSENRLGNKTNSGFYRKGDSGLNENDKILVEKNYNSVINLLASVFINSFYKVVEKRVSTFEKLDGFVKEYLGIDDSINKLATEIGVDNIKKILSKKYSNSGCSIYFPSTLL